VQKTRGAPKDITKLREIDANLATVKAELENVVKKIGRISSEIAAAIVEKDKHFAQLAKFETENATALSKLRLRKEGDSGVDSVLAVYEKQMQELLERKAAQYQRRDERRRELRKLQEALERQYLTVEKDFVPLFRELAYRFLGIDLDVRMETQGTSGINLVLDVRSAARRQHHQLSESQRFFVDIALRMALAQFMSTEKQTATLFIDTPEGSLDIAYEKRAGDMLAEFVARDYHIVMTANINSSRLLQELATRVGKKKMFLCRMTSWTELSEVQVEEEDLFEEAYAVIEGSLNPKRGARK
jgi:DNA repair exonuclease SbcCD ATPase subunit